MTFFYSFKTHFFINLLKYDFDKIIFAMEVDSKELIS